MSRSAATSALPPELTARYLGNLAERREEILQLMQDGGPEARQALRTITHRLAGTGASYGFPAVSKAGRRLDEALQADAPAPEEVDTATQGLLAALQAAISGA